MKGLVIGTDSERVLEARRFVVEILISCHPLDCMTCETAGDCALQDLAHGSGSDGSCTSKEKGANRLTDAAYGRAAFMAECRACAVTLEKPRGRYLKVGNAYGNSRAYV